MTLKQEKSRREILECPYIRVMDLITLTGLSRTTVQKVLKKEKCRKFEGYGYLTDDIIKAFRLESYVERMNFEKTATKPLIPDYRA